MVLKGLSKFEWHVRHELNLQEIFSSKYKYFIHTIIISLCIFWSNLFLHFSFTSDVSLEESCQTTPKLEAGKASFCSVTIFDFTSEAILEETLSNDL